MSSVVVGRASPKPSQIETRPRPPRQGSSAFFQERLGPTRHSKHGFMQLTTRPHSKHGFMQLTTRPSPEEVPVPYACEF